MPYKNLVIFYSTAKHPSPFDVQLIYDAGADHVITYSDVKPEDAKSLTLDAMFPRGPEGVKHTVLFIGGSDMEGAEKITEKARKAMFPPFEMAIVSDPRGAYTTSAALVTKAEDALKKKFEKTLDGSNVTILAGAGRVGSLAATLLAIEKANVTIADIAADLADKRAKEINEMVKEERVKVSAEYPKEGAYPACKDADIVLTTGPPGVQLLTKEVLEKLSRCKVLADVNAVPPHGVEGLKPSWDCKEVVPNIFAVGALRVGDLKNKIESSLIRKAIEVPKGYFGYKEAFEVGRESLK